VCQKADLPLLSAALKLTSEAPSYWGQQDCGRIGPSQTHLAPSDPKALALAGLKVLFPGSSTSRAPGGWCSLLLNTAPSQRHKRYESSCMDSPMRQNESMSF